MIRAPAMQNLCAKADTPVASRPEPTALDIARTAAVARLLRGDSVNLQVPPNLSGDGRAFFLTAGINDWGGISPVTRDFINPEMAWPEIVTLRHVAAKSGFELPERLTAYPEYIRDSGWTPENLRRRALVWMDDAGLARRQQEGA